MIYRHDQNYHMRFSSTAETMPFSVPCIRQLFLWWYIFIRQNYTRMLRQYHWVVFETKREHQRSWRAWVTTSKEQRIILAEKIKVWLLTLSIYLISLDKDHPMISYNDQSFKCRNTSSPNMLNKLARACH